MPTEAQGATFLGVGWAFPVRAHTGAVAISAYEQSVREGIWIVLGTAPGERQMRPDFGCGIHEYVFAVNDSNAAGAVADAVREALRRWEPRIDLLDVDANVDPAEPGALLIRIDYRVRATNNVFNLVYPFYVDRGAT